MVDVSLLYKINSCTKPHTFVKDLGLTKPGINTPYAALLLLGSLVWQTYIDWRLSGVKFLFFFFIAKTQKTKNLENISLWSKKTNRKNPGSLIRDYPSNDNFRSDGSNILSINTTAMWLVYLVKEQNSVSLNRNTFHSLLPHTYFYYRKLIRFLYPTTWVF